MGTLSIAMIVKNEAAHLPECLAGLRGLADEICVVDTGSSDGSIALAEAAGCKRGHFTWCDDFAAARNASLDLCTGEWILVMDADERIAPEDAPRIRALTRAGERRAYRFVTRNYTNAAHLSEFTRCAPDDPWARGFLGWHPSTKVRLFPRHPEARFQGKVHELVNPPLLALGIEILMSEVPIHHYPLTKPESELRRKQEMYIRLGLEKRREHPNDARLAAELGNQYAELGDYRNAAAAYRDAARLEPENPLWLKDLGGMLHLLGRSGDAVNALELSLRLDEQQPEAWRNLGVVHAHGGRWAQALVCFERYARLAPAAEDAERCLALAREQAPLSELETRHHA